MARVVVRDWRDALSVHLVDRCIVCGRTGTELAHLVGRAYDRRRPGSRARYVHPLSVVRLCGPQVNSGTCHNRYDAHRLNLVPYLTGAQIAWCVERIGEGQAMRRLMGREAWDQSRPKEG